jgi:hypothetical protein
LLQKHLVRLACIRHAASVHPEPGSNSPQKIFTLASVVYGFFTGSTELLLPITIQLLKFGVQSGLDFTSSTLACQGSSRRKDRCLCLSTSARQTAKPQACVSDGDFPTQFSMICQGDEIFRYTGEWLLYTLSRFCQALSDSLS